MQALIAGSGDLPAAIAAAASNRPLVAALEGFAPNGLQVDLTFRLETLGTLIAALQERGVTEVCLCGAIARPTLQVSALDRATLRLVPSFLRALRKGDDGALRVLIGLLEKAGFAVRAAQDIAPGLLPPEGMLSATAPYPEAAADAACGDLVSQSQGAQDLGQACVIRDGIVLAREDDRGTDVMLAGLRDDSQAPPKTRSGLFYKAPKPNQDHRADLPVVGPGTVQAVARAGLAGLVVAAEGVLVLHQDRVRAACDAAGLFFWVRPR